MIAERRDLYFFMTFLCAINIASNLWAKAAVSQTLQEGIAAEHDIMNNWHGSILESNMAIYRSALRKNMTASELQVDREIRVQVIRNSAPIVQAFVEGNGRRVIQIYTGFTRRIEHFARYITYVALRTPFQTMAQERGGRSYQRLTEDISRSHKAMGYIDYIIEKIELPKLSGRAEIPLTQIQSFPEFAGISETEYQEFLADPNTDSMMRSLMYSSMVALIAHELGHHFGNHFPRDTTLDGQRRQEEEADETAFRLLHGRNYLFTALPAFFTLYIVDPHRPRPLRIEALRTHPSSLKRLRRAHEVALQEILADASMMNTARQLGIENTFVEGIRHAMESMDRQLRQR
jgi:hypothetical protein